MSLEPCIPFGMKIPFTATRTMIILYSFRDEGNDYSDAIIVLSQVLLVRYEDVMYRTQTVMASLRTAARCRPDTAAAGVTSENGSADFRTAQSPAARKGIFSFNAATNAASAAAEAAATSEVPSPSFEERAMLHNLQQEWRADLPDDQLAAACALLDRSLLALLSYTCVQQQRRRRRLHHGPNRDDAAVRATRRSGGDGGAPPPIGQ